MQTRAMLLVLSNKTGHRCLVLLMLLITGLNANESSSRSLGDASLGTTVAAVIVFGDSTVDVGMNNNLPTLVRSNFPPYGMDFEGGQATGRFCDGRVPTDFLASAVGLPSPPAYFSPEARDLQNILHGVSFASSASGYNDNTAKFFNVMSLTTQLELFKSYKDRLNSVIGREAASQAVVDAVYLLSTGSNDYVNNYVFNLRLRSKVNKEQYKVFLLENAQRFMQSLYDLGARKLIIVSLPPLGCLPVQRTVLGGLRLAQCVDAVNDEAFAFNHGLQELVATMEAQYQDYKLIYLDSFGPLLDMYNNPSKYGFEEVQRACCSTGTVEVAYLCNRLENGLTCKDPAKYMWWDSYHPTEAAYNILCNMFRHQILNGTFLTGA